jgi:hypothetical protein
MAPKKKVGAKTTAPKRVAPKKAVGKNVKPKKEATIRLTKGNIEKGERFYAQYHNTWLLVHYGEDDNGEDLSEGIYPCIMSFSRPSHSHFD